MSQMMHDIFISEFQPDMEHPQEKPRREEESP